MKYNVELEFWRHDEVEADSEEEAIMKALIKATNDPNDYFTAEDEIANRILDNFNNYSNATEEEE
jgi:hypothetical protein